MKNKKDYQKSMRTMSFKEIQHVRGGRLWPFFNLQSILQNIWVGEDLTMGDFIPEKN